MSPIKININKFEMMNSNRHIYSDVNGKEHDANPSIKSSWLYPYAYENVSDTMKAYFKRNVCDYAPIRVEAGDHFFEWTPFGIGFADEFGNEEWLGRINDAPAGIEDDNRILYKNIVPHVDDEFIVEAGSLKHNTILHSRLESHGTLLGGQNYLVVEGKIDFSSGINLYVENEIQPDLFTTMSSIVCKDEIGKEVFSLPSPIAFEIYGSKSIQCSYKVSKHDNMATLQIRVPWSWLSHKDRSYPIAIDPTLRVVGSPNAPRNRIRNVNFSPSSSYLSVNYLYKPTIYKMDQTTKSFIELPEPTGGYNGRGEALSRFSKSEKYFLYSGYFNFQIYEFDAGTGGFTKPSTSTMADPRGDIADFIFSHHNDYLILAGYKQAEVYAWNEDTGMGALKSKRVLTNEIRRLFISSDDSILLAFLYNKTIKACSLQDGVVINDYPLTIPKELSGKILDVDVSSDFKYITFALSEAPFICVCKLDADSGIIDSPTFPALPGDVTPRAIRFSPKERFIAIAQYDAWKNKPKLFFYRFHQNTGLIGERIDIDPSIAPDSSRNFSNEVQSLSYSMDGNYIALGQDTTVPDSLFIYQAFYEADDNIFFKDEASQDYYSDHNGISLMLIDFETIIAGQTTPAKQVVLENLFNYSVKNVQLFVDNPSSEFQVELSMTETPFIPEKQLHYPATTLAPYDTLPFYIRVTSSELAKGGGTFNVRVKCDKA